MPLPSVPPPASPGAPPATQQPIGTQPASALGATGSLQDRIARLETGYNFLSNYTAYPITNEPGFTMSSPTNVILGGITIPWYQLRPKLHIPDARWDAWASGWLQNTTGSAVLSIIYQRDDTSTVVLVPTTFGPVASVRKVSLGPAPVKGPMAAAAGAPQNESILSIGIMGNINTGTATCSRWTLWIRQSPTRG